MLYIDPSSVSILLSSITAIAVACGAAIIIAVRSIKKKVNKALHIDENSKKEVEDELVLSDDLKEAETADGASSEAESTAEAVEEAPAKEVKEAVEEVKVADEKKDNVDTETTTKAKKRKKS